MEKKSNTILIISVVTGILLATLVGILVYFNLPAQRIRRMFKTAHKYIADENYDEAILTLKKMLEIDPKNENIYVLLANTYEKNGDIDKEVEFLQEAVTMMPENQKISEVLLDVYPEVTLSEGSGTYTDPVTLSMSSSEESEIFYKISGSDNESKYSSPVNLGKNGKYIIEYYAVSKNGYEGEHKTATYVINLDESKYHFNEWVDETDGRHYYDENGVSVTGWFQIKGKWYLFDSNCVMLTGFREDKGNTYYLRPDGIMVIGWQDIDGKRYFFDDNGAMLKNQWIDNTFYVGADGAMLVDTVTPDGQKVGKDGKKYFQTNTISLITSPGEYVGSIFHGSYDMPEYTSYIFDQEINGDILTLKGIMSYYPSTDSVDPIVLQEGDYNFQLYSGTEYGYVDDFWDPMSRAEFEQMVARNAGICIGVFVENGVVTRVQYSA
ncbi:tetratricopeptide repeat protein [Oribacterium sp. FC2011]|uniref:tetratricopeptide repeat protein n=1 Tax=Oribacterium sp. FC2011 TaxID=1408311 RepID=UPI0004E248BC|nr:tetratricopeptide repeat protein [Oribacterium sp. FC2011]